MNKYTNARDKRALSSICLSNCHASVKLGYILVFLSMRIEFKELKIEYSRISPIAREVQPERKGFLCTEF